MKKIPSWLKTLLTAMFGFTIALANSSPNLATTYLPDADEHAAISFAQLKPTYDKLPLSFEANFGQTDASVKFLSRGSGYNLFLTPTEAVFTLGQPQGKSKAVDHRPSVKPQPTVSTSNNVLHMQLVGSNQLPQVNGLEPLPGKVNYFLGNDPKHWHTNIPTYAKVQYQQVYPGVDMVYYGQQGKLEYDFVLEPGTDPNAIKMAVQGADQLKVNDQQELVLHTTGGEVKLHKPLVYQQVKGIRQEIASNYVLKGENQVGFQVAAYDRSQPLTIDPVLSYSTYLGGSSADSGSSIAVDRLGNAYVTGFTFSTNFPTQNSFQANGDGSYSDAFVTKLDATGTALVYSTYLGGSNYDYSNGIAVDRAGNAYITGTTSSNDFPTQNPFQASCCGAFVTKLDATGAALAYSTYLSGGIANSIAVDRAGNAYVTGYTSSANFPTKNPFQATLSGRAGDAFVTKLNATGSALVYSTYLGGSTAPSGRGNSGNAISVDRAGNAYITGETQSSNFPTKNPFQATVSGPQNAFVTKLDPTGSALVYSSYLGDNGNSPYYGDTIGNSIAVDRVGNAYVTGYTGSRNFPTVNPFQASQIGVYNDVFVTKVNATGSALLYSTYLGGSDSDIGNGIAVDKAGNAYVTGYTGSTDFPTQNPFQTALSSGGVGFGGGTDAFITKLNATGSALVYSTYLGGDADPMLGPHNIGYGIAVDTEDNAYVTGRTLSTNFPTQNPFQAAYGGSSYGDAFVAKITRKQAPNTK